MFVDILDVEIRCVVERNGDSFRWIVSNNASMETGNTVGDEEDKGGDDQTPEMTKKLAVWEECQVHQIPNTSVATNNRWVLIFDFEKIPVYTKV